MRSNEGLSTRVTVGSVILAIMLLSIFGVSRAFRSLTGSEPERIESSRVDAFTATNEPDASSRTARQNDASTPDIRTRNEDGELEFTPLQTAGTFIQRQQRIEEDPTVLATEVSVVAVADDSASTPTQNNTINGDQTSTSETPSSTAPTTSTAPATAPAAVPALW